LTEAQRQAVLAEARSERFADRSPEYIVTTLLEEGKYHCSIRTLYRLLAQCGETTPRRRQRKHPPYQRPELMATAPNQTWTWDITLLRGPHRGVYYRLYVILDLFSRYTVGWLLARRQYLDARNPVIAIRPDVAEGSKEIISICMDFLCAGIISANRDKGTRTVQSMLELIVSTPGVIVNGVAYNHSDGSINTSTHWVVP